ncbi:MAG TPA: hypothetical protein VMZ71_14425 [Gemmataceae bacterium]|nr:hypothetical protein [Gemmataceae bacterium]
MTTDTATPAELIRKTLTDAPAPLKLADITKAKKAQPATQTILQEGVEQGWVVVAKSGAKGAERYWSRDEKHAIRDAVMEAATEPKSLAALKTAAKAVTKADTKFAAAVVDELVAAGQLHAHPKGKTFGKNPPPLIDDPVKVTAALVGAAASPQPLAALVKATVATTKAGKAFVEGIANGLIDNQLFAHAPTRGKTPLYGTQKPRVVPPLERKENAGAFSKLVAAATKLLTGAGVTADELVTALRAKLAGAPPADFTISHAAEKLATSPHAPPAAPPPPLVVPKPPDAPAPLTSERIRTALKSAYDLLRNYVEGEDGMVEIRRLYHEVKKSLPALSVSEFHRELTALQQQWVLELHSLTEVQHAKEPELAIHQNDRLLYFVMWR